MRPEISKKWSHKSFVSAVDQQLCPCGETQTMSHSVESWMAAHLGYTLRMKTLFRGWPVMAHVTRIREEEEYQQLAETKLWTERSPSPMLIW